MAPLSKHHENVFAKNFLSLHMQLCILAQTSGHQVTCLTTTMTTTTKNIALGLLLDAVSVGDDGDQPAQYAMWETWDACLTIAFAKATRGVEREGDEVRCYGKTGFFLFNIPVGAFRFWPYKDVEPAEASFWASVYDEAQA